MSPPGFSFANRASHLHLRDNPDLTHHTKPFKFHMVTIICYAVKRKRPGPARGARAEGDRAMKTKKPAFMCDRMLGKLCRRLRLLGYDAKLNPERETGRFFLNAEFEGRVAVTRARGLRDRPGGPPIVLESE
ncbi:MAG TPA: hypothetical protein ENO08_06545, partial [Candidatus Eisenbacteria bacterium]|nr:hypothetical protein [Candidatus Eisenbacteria bacterium]